MTDDRAARQFINDFFSEPGSGPSIPPVPAEPAPRTRQLRATFREPTTGFPGTKAFSTRPLNPRASGATVQSKTIGPDGPPAHSPRADDAQGRRAAVTGAGMLLTSGNDHLKKLEIYSKKKQAANRLQWI